MNHFLTNPLSNYYSKKTDVILLAHSLLGTVRGKSANGLLIHEELFNVVAIVDFYAVGKLTSEICQGVWKNVPIYPNMEIAVHFHKADALVILSNPEESWHTDIKMAVQNNLDIINTTFNFIKNTPAIKSLMDYYKVKYFDLRDVTHLKAYPNCNILKRKSTVVYVTGTDCGLGKRTAAFQLHKEAIDRKIKSAMLATGQTGLMLGEPGSCVDALTIEFSNGVVSQQIMQLSEQGYELIFVEGQSDIFHPANSAVALSILHGANPDMIILVHDDDRKYHKGFEENEDLYKMHSLIRYIETLKMLSLPCGPIYNTVGIATIGITNIKKIRRIVQGTDIVVDDVRTTEGPVNIIDKILDYDKYGQKSILESYNIN